MKYFISNISIEERLKKDFILIGHFKVDDYHGMVLSLVLSKNKTSQQYLIDVEWSCFGLDHFGDTLQESYTYEFSNLKLAVAFLEKNYQIQSDKIPRNYQFDQRQFPNPITDRDKKSLYEINWNRFESDFRNGKFLILNEKLVYNSANQ